METYNYLCVERPPSPGAVPKRGLIGIADTDIEHRGRTAYAVITYDRKLTESEMKSYELVEIQERGGMNEAGKENSK